MSTRSTLSIEPSRHASLAHGDASLRGWFRAESHLPASASAGGTELSSCRGADPHSEICSERAPLRAPGHNRPGTERSVHPSPRDEKLGITDATQGSYWSFHSRRRPTEHTITMYSVERATSPSSFDPKAKVELIKPNHLPTNPVKGPPKTSVH